MALELQEVGSDSSAKTGKDEGVVPSTTTVVASSCEPSTNTAIPSAKVDPKQKVEKDPASNESLDLKLEETFIESPKKAENANTSPVVETLNSKKEEDSIKTEKDQRVPSSTSTVVASSDNLSTKTVETDSPNLKKEVESPVKTTNVATELKNIQTNFPSTSNVPTEQNTDQPMAGCSSNPETTARPSPPKRTAEASLPSESKRAKHDPSPSTSVSKRKKRIRPKFRRRHRSGAPAGYGKALFVNPAPGYTEGDVQRILRTANTTFTVNNMPFSVLPIRYTASGGFCIQFVGKKGNTRVNDVMEKLQRLPDISKVVLRGPVDMGEIFIRKIPSTISPEQVAAAVARVGRCSVTDITVGKMKKMSSGQKLYICCPVKSAKIVNRSGEIKVGNYTCKLRVPRGMRKFENSLVNPEFCRLCGSSRHLTQQCGVVLPYRVEKSYFSYPSTSVSHRSSYSSNYDSNYFSGHTSGYSSDNSRYTMLELNDRVPYRNSGSDYMWQQQQPF